jgi:hypothetical protein
MAGSIPRGGRLGRAAFAAVARGWFVFPVHPGSKVPAVEKWEAVATRDPRQIRQWWSVRPYNIGIACGPSRLLVIDIDIAFSDIDMNGVDAAEDIDPSPPAVGASLHGGGGPVGVEVLLQRAAEVGVAWPPQTYAVTTPRGGRHWYFRAPAGPAWRNTQGTLGTSVDTRGRGGFVVAAGSTDRHGRRYRVAHDHPAMSMPDWLIAALTPPPSPRLARPDSLGRPASSGRLSGRRVEAYLRAVIAGETAVVANAPVGQRHTILLAAARRLGHWVGGGLLPDHDARVALTRAARHFVGVAGYTAQQVDRDIDDGIAYGARTPRGTAFISGQGRGDPRKK